MNTFGGILDHSSGHILSRPTFLGLCSSTDLFNSAPQVFYWIEVWWLRWPLQNVDLVFAKPFLCGSWGMLWVIVFLESPPTAKSQPSGRGNQIFCLNWLILGGIHYAINPNQCPWTSGIKTAPKHDWPTTPWMTKGYCTCVTSFLYPSETGSEIITQYSSLIHR